MGVYTNYEVEFADFVSWDDDQVRRRLATFNCFFLYLRDMETMTLMFSVYSQHEIKEVLDILYEMYDVQIKYRVYSSQIWKHHKY